MPCLSKVLEKLVNYQLTGFLDVYSFLSGIQSCFRSGYGCVTATFKVLNDVTIALDSKQCCATIFIDLAKAFDTVEYFILVGRLRSIGVSEGSLAWFANYLSQRVQCVKSTGQFHVHLYIQRLNHGHLTVNFGLIRKCGRRRHKDGVTLLRSLRSHAEAKLSSVPHRRAPLKFCNNAEGAP
jgi:hypothetical protein